MKVKLFTNVLRSKLEKEFNQWAQGLKYRDSIFDIKFQANSQGIILLVFYDGREKSKPININDILAKLSIIKENTHIDLYTKMDILDLMNKIVKGI